jgi:hypothetical protein
MIFLLVKYYWGDEIKEDYTAGNVARICWKRDAYSVLLGRSEGKRQLGRTLHRWEDNTELHIK